MKDCLFCKIIKGEIPSYTIYEDDLVKVFLDVNPVTNGHCLIIPKKHYENFVDVDDKILTHTRKVANKIYEMYKDKINADGITVVQNNFYGQAIKHFHVHLIPRYENDKVDWKRQKNRKKVENIYKEIVEK